MTPPDSAKTADVTASGPRGKTTRMGDTTEQQVRRAAVDLFASRGFHATGIRQLAETVGINSSTLYHYMGTKEDLLFAIVQDSSRRLIDAAQRLVDLASTPEAMMCALVQMHVSVHATHRAETAVVDNELRHLDSDRRHHAVELRDVYENFWTITIAAGVKDGSFTVHDQRLARLAILQMCSGVAEWYSPKGQLLLRELAQTHAHMTLQLLGDQCGFDTVVKLLEPLDVQEIVDEVWSPEPAPASGSRSPAHRQSVR
jgi:AcrR family transcriptional regulator